MIFFLICGFLSHFKTNKMFTSINKHSALCLYCDEVSAILQALRCCPGQVGRRNLIVTRGMLKPVYFAFVETISDFCLFVCSFVCFFCKLHILHLGSRGPSAKYLRWNKQVDIKSSFSSAHRASLTRLRREPSESIRKKMSSGIQGKHFVKLWAHSPRPTSKII